MTETYKPGAELKRRRTTVGHGLKSAARRLKMDPAQLSRIENELWKRMSVDLAIRIRDEYGIPLEVWGPAANDENEVA